MITIIHYPLNLCNFIAPNSRRARNTLKLASHSIIYKSLRWISNIYFVEINLSVRKVRVWSFRHPHTHNFRKFIYQFIPTVTKIIGIIPRYFSLLDLAIDVFNLISIDVNLGDLNLHLRVEILLPITDLRRDSVETINKS